MFLITPNTLSFAQENPQSDVFAASPSTSEQSPSLGANSVLEPIQEFHLFPKLPIELRQRIFRTAVPDIVPPTIQVMLDCDMIGSPTQPGVGIATNIFFCFSNEYEIRTTKLDLALLSTCHDSRKAYKLANPNFLPLQDPQSRFYYNATFDVVYITNFSYLLFDRPLSEYIRSQAVSGLETPKFICDIKKLAVTADTFTEWQSAASKSAVGEDGLGRLLDYFKGIDVIAAVIKEDEYDWEAPIAVMREYWRGRLTIRDAALLVEDARILALITGSQRSLLSMVKISLL